MASLSTLDKQGHHLMSGWPKGGREGEEGGGLGWPGVA